MASIEPTVGRVVLFWPDQNFPGAHHDTGKPLAAIVAHVFDPTLVNLTVFDSSGYSFAQGNVTLLAADQAREPGRRCAEWMPYQKGQAAKTEQLEKKIAGGA